MFPSPAQIAAKLSMRRIQRSKIFARFPWLKLLARR